MTAGASELRARWRRLVDGPQRLAAPEHADVLDIGCGRLKSPGSVGIDRLADTDADIVHDLDMMPYPIAENSFDAVIARHVLEHVAAPLGVLAELHRVTRPGGVVTIITPHFSSSSSWTDPTHRHHFTSRSFDYLIEGADWSYYTAVRYEMMERRLTLGMLRGPGGRVVPLLRIVGVEALVNRFLDPFEKWWAFALPLGPKDLVLRMRTVK